MLFPIFINNFSVVIKCLSYLFADDTTLFRSHNNTAQLELKVNFEQEEI